MNMARAKLEVVGKTFNFVTVLSETDERQGRAPLYLCRCVCGNEFKSTGPNVSSGNKKSCGCKRGFARIGTKSPGLAARNKANAKHGMTGTKTWNAWASMKERCDNKSHKFFKDYGGRGIKYVAEWSEFDAFLKDMGEAAPGFTLDRVNNDLGYSKDNCRWTTQKTQCNNRRSNVFVEFEGKSQTIAQWAEEKGIERKTLEYRIRVGWPAEKALNTRSLINRKGAINGI